jgi:hypothetical protein
MKFGLITEGPTDQTVIKSLLVRFFADPAVKITTVQPNTDSTDSANHYGGWKLVLDYCKSPDMTTALEINDYVVIQIDTDVCEEYGVAKRENGANLSADEIIERIKGIIVDCIGADLYTQYKHKIIFAISYESIECWLLPLYLTGNNRSKTLNCCDVLSRELSRRTDFFIDCNSKKPLYYKEICKEIKRKEQIVSISVHNNSFEQFVAQLSSITG